MSDTNLPEIDFKGQTFKLGTLLPPTFPDTLPKLSAAPGFRVWSKVEIEDFIRNKPVKRRQQFAGKDWIVNQGNVGSCFPPGTLIRMADGSQKKIDRVQLLDEVLTAEGNRRRVMRTMVRSHTGVIHRIKVWGHRHLRATAEHPILTKRGYVPVESLTKDDWVAIPKYAPNRIESIVPAEYVNVGNLRSRRLLASIDKGKDWIAQIPGKKATRISVSSLPEIIKLDRRFGRLVGLFLAEGSSSEGKIVFHFHTKELGTLVSEVADSFRELFGVESVVVTGRGNRPNCTEIKVYGKMWVQLFTELCATGSSVKRVHPALCGGPKEFLEGVLSGWMDGDGLGKEHSHGGVTVSHELAMNMYDIATALGYRPTVETLQVAVNPKHKIKRRLLRYVVKWPKSGGGNVLAPWSEQDERYVWRKVAEVDTESYSGHVYNLEVEDDHSYVAESIGVHNCNAAAATGALRRAMFLNGRNDVPMLNWEFLYAQINGGRDQGSMLDDGMNAIVKTGVPVMKPDHKFNRAIFQNYYKPEDYAEAGKWTASNCFTLDQDQPELAERQLATLVLSGQGAGVVAVHVGSNYNNFTNGGFIGQDSGPGNHAVGADDAEIINGELSFNSPGSWGLDWGDDGYGYLSWNKHFKQTSKYHAFYAVLAASNPGDGAPAVKE